MNSRSELRRLFETNGFREASFSYLDDLSTLGQFRIGSRLELWAWRLLRALRLRYPESCLLGVYQKARKNPVENP